MNLKERFNKLDQGKKKIVVWAFIGGVVLLIATLGYNSRGERAVIASSSRERDIVLDRDLIEKTMLKEQRRQIRLLQEAVAKLEKQRNLNGSLAPVGEEEETTELHIPTPEELIAKQQEEEANKKAEAGGIREDDANMNYPPPPPAAFNPQQQQRQQQQRKMIGDIGVLSNKEALEEKNGNKKKGRSVYLPPSFMEAQLLTGFDASTSGRGKKNPEPLLLRIQTPAVLPNDVKAGLAGCFVIAEAVGRLDKERADVRLVSLSCLTDKGKAIIDTPVKGFVTDSDSKVGLAGRVVSKMGASTARAVVAGFFGGMGDMFREASTTKSTSAFGTVSTIKSDDVVQYGLGGGLAEGADTLREFYLDLAKQATPVIEVGAAKKITVIVSEGKELEIRDIPTEDF